MKNIEINNPSQELIELFSYKEWRQRIHLYDDVYTPGTRCEYEWDLCKLPNNLSKQSFIDVGANDGMMSFLAEQKGAKSVTSVDIYIDTPETDWEMTKGWYIGRINNVKKQLKSAIDVKNCSIYNLDTLNKKFDVTYCGNVIAWVQNPIAALSQLSSITENTLIIREDISRIKGKPVLEYVNNSDFTTCNFNGNKAFYIKTLKSFGFKNVEIIPVDEYEIVERRENDFKKYTIKLQAKVYKNPFTDEISNLNTNLENSMATIKINNRCFFNKIGWVSENDIELFKIQLIPTNPIKKIIFENKYRKNLLDNSMIFATR